MSLLIDIYLASLVITSSWAINLNFNDHARGLQLNPYAPIDWNGGGVG